MDSQQMIIHRGIKMPKPVLSVEFNIPHDFTGRVVIHIENGLVTGKRRLSDDECICSIDSFIKIARDMELRLKEISND
ncbi:TPA: hypothetical protein ACWV6C_005510 [Salmonella enterica subsp. enterica serovar Muenchen]|nr:hypothetical protein [Salmonella enterica subsp. enterica serovar Java]